MQSMTWDELADCHRDLAQKLMEGKVERFARGVCSRAYYAAYALVTARLPKSAQFAHGWQNPGHAQLPAFVGSISNLSEQHCREIRRALRRLRHRREDADYRPGVTVGTETARESMRDAVLIFVLLRQG